MIGVNVLPYVFAVERRMRPGLFRSFFFIAHKAGCPASNACRCPGVEKMPDLALWMTVRDHRLHHILPAEVVGWWRVD